MEARTNPPRTSQHYARNRERDGEAHTIIRIQNLSAQALVGGAIWGPENNGGRWNQVQPVFFSAALSLKEPFKSAAHSDEVNETTVNYSTLSKEILKVVASRNPTTPHSDDFQGLLMDFSLSDLLEWIEIYLTGCLPSGRHPRYHRIRGYIEGGCPCLEGRDNPAYKPPLLDIKKFHEVDLKIFLPKATLLSGGVSLSTSSRSPRRNDRNMIPYSSVLKIHDMRIPTLIGVNKNERLARQIVVVNVEIDPYVCKEHDCYNELEQIVVKVRLV
jgi:dihydroneopterin aldolase